VKQFVSATLAGLIGRSITASRSPTIHQDEAQTLGLSLSYRLVDFNVLDWPDEDLPRAIALLRHLGFAGCNVTFPFKQQVVEHCTTLSREAEMLGAVNTLIFNESGIHGENTDWLGFSWMIEREIGSIGGASVAQIGAGGAGSATALALASSGAAEIALFDPEPAKAELLRERLSPHFRNTRFTFCKTAEFAIKGRDGVVNASPIGMAGFPGMPFAPSLMSPEQWVADIIYFPLQTQLLQYARDNGHRTANGVSMVVGQAAEAFRLLTGIKPDRERMLTRLEASIRSEQSAPQLAA
jgi:shikimate dehydrogenase